MPTTMKDIAREAGVAITTVSKVLNDRDMNISAATKQKVLEIAERLQYVPNSMAKGLRTNTSRMIGVVLDDISDPFYSLYMRGIAETAQKKGFGVLFFSTSGSEGEEASPIKFLSSRMIDGIIIDKIASLSNKEALLLSKYPIIADVNEFANEAERNRLNIGSVFIDTQSAIFDATGLLIDKGCTKIAFISSKNEHYGIRLDGYRESLEARGIPYDPQLVFLGRFDVQTGRDGLASILGGGAVDGVVCGNDLIAIGVLEEAKRRNISVPNGLKVIGLDDIWMAQHTSPALTTIHQPIYEQGVEGAGMLIDNILSGTPLRKKSLQYHIVEREST